MAVALGVLLTSAVPARTSIRGLAQGEFAAWSAATPIAASFGFVPSASDATPTALVFALPGLVVVAIVCVLVESRLTRRVRMSRIGGLYGP